MGVCLATPLADASDKERQRARDALCRGKTPLHKAEQWSAEGAYSDGRASDVRREAEFSP